MAATGQATVHPRATAELQYRQLCAEAKERGGPFPNLITKRIAEKDLYFFLVFVLNRQDARHDWVFDRCREVQAEPDDVLDLWARGHYKSTIGTFAMNLWDIIHNPEITIGIFSFNRPEAKKFLRQIKRECETNKLLHELWPDIFWQDPSREAPVWSEDSGLIMKRKSNPPESTVEAWGLVEGAPVGRHFKKLDFDDIVTRDSVTNPEQINRTTEGWALALNLTSKNPRICYRGTRWNYQDTYREILDREAAKARVYPCVDETEDPVLLSQEEINKKRRSMGPTVFAAQMMLDPKMDSTVGFLEEWIQFHDGIEAPASSMNRYIVVDPANERKEKKSDSDYTAVWVIGLSSDDNFYMLDMFWDRIGLEERVDLIFKLHRKWKPKKIGYEQYGLMADVAAIKMRQKSENYRFAIVELGGKLGKRDRILGLEPLYAAERIYLPPYLYYCDKEGTTHDLVQVFVQREYKPWPACRHDDLLDSQARILDPDMQIVWPRPIDRTTPVKEARRGSHWAA